MNNLAPRDSAGRKRSWIFILIAVVVVVAGTAAFVLSRHPVSLIKETEWAIGIYQGDSVFNLSPVAGIPNPVLSRTDVTDHRAEFVADPFMVKTGESWFMFFEVMDSATRHGDIGCATSPDGLRWKYLKTVLHEPFHLSYPYVFEWEGRFYMIPESAEGKSVRLYRAESFPTSWTYVTSLIQGRFGDTCVFYADKTWWMLTCGRPKTHDELRLFFADDLTGPWTEHPASPVVRGDPTRGQNGGRVLAVDEGLVRFAQDDRGTYGKRVRTFMITELSRTQYKEVERQGGPVLGASGRGWNRHGMHHVDAHELTKGKWIAAVDGYKKRLVLQMEY